MTAHCKPSANSSKNERPNHTGPRDYPLSDAIAHVLNADRHFVHANISSAPGKTDIRMFEVTREKAIKGLTPANTYKHIQTIRLSFSEDGTTVYIG